MICQHYRDAVSALLDGEEPGLAPELLERHLHGCASCREWRDAAGALARAVRIAPAEEVPDLTRAILETAAARATARAGGRARLGGRRVALVLVALAQLALGLADLLGGEGAATHSIRELGSWDFALAIGFLFAAWRPARAWGMVPLVTAVAACLLLSSGVDLASGRALPTRETSHALEVAGMVLLWLLARAHGARWGTPASLAPPSTGSGPRGDRFASVAPGAAPTGRGRAQGGMSPPLGPRSARGGGTPPAFRELLGLGGRLPPPMRRATCRQAPTPRHHGERSDRECAA